MQTFVRIQVRAQALAIILVLASSALMLPEDSSAADENMLLTIFLKHDQSMDLDEIKEHLASKNFWTEFPPAGVEIVSWRIVMGIGHVVTLSFPPKRLREVNLAIESKAWGAFRTEFYPTYDYLEIVKARRAALRELDN